MAKIIKKNRGSDLTMTKEQEARIKLLEDFIKIDFSNPMGWTGYYDTELKELSNAIETVLNMLKEKDKYIKDANDITTEMSNDIKKLTSEIEKKDKIIDLMAERIEWLCKSNGILLDKEHDENFTQQDIKQYFERKVKNEN